MVSLTSKRSPSSAARRNQQAFTIKNATDGGEKIDDGNYISRRSLVSSNGDDETATPTQATKQRVHPSIDSTKLPKGLCHDHPNAKYRVRDPRGLLLLSFPLKLHLILEKYELERLHRKRNNPHPNKENERNGDDKNRDHNDTRASDSCNDETIKAERNNAVIRWLPTNNSFKIYDEKRFVKEIMPYFFFGHGSKHMCFETFQRSLELWGFTHMTCVEGPTTQLTHVCSHPLFIKGNPGACNRMRFRIDHQVRW